MAPPVPASTQRLHLIDSERHLFSTSDDRLVMKQIEATHAPDGRYIDVVLLLNIVEDVLQHAKPTAGATPQAHLELVDDGMHHPEVLVGMLEALAHTIHKISCEISYKCSGGSDGHTTAVHVFGLLSNFGWDAKAVLALAAFAVSYGEFWLTAQLQSVNPLAKSVAFLKQLPDIVEHGNILKPRFDALGNLIGAMLDVTKCIIEFTNLPSEHISPDSPDMSMAMTHIPTAVYWTIRSVIACSSQIIGLIGVGHEYIASTNEAWELSSLTHKVRNIHGNLTKQLALCHNIVEEKRRSEAYTDLVRLFDTDHMDNLKILRALISSREELPLIDGHLKRRDRLDVLRRKIVLLFVSDLDVPPEELLILIQLFTESHQGKFERDYEIVWLPILDRHKQWTQAEEQRYASLASSMPWYSLHDPSLVEWAAVKYARDVWRFDKKPIMVALDHQGKVASPNALHMMWIWGTLAFPFSSSREEALWREETWRVGFLVDEIDPELLTWVREGRYVCLYGGEDIEWIRRFTTLLRSVFQEAGLSIEMVYVGKSNPKERVKKAVAAIAAENLSGYWQDPMMMWFFWVRLESMLHSKMNHGRTVDEDHILQEVMAMLSFDSGDGGWAVISRGSADFAKANGQTLMKCLEDFNTWKHGVDEQGFIVALVNALAPYHTHEHCTRLILPGDTGRIKEQVVCAECKRPMEKFILYRCCND